MMNWWSVSNKTIAQEAALNQLIGKLQSMEEHNQQPTCKELLDFIGKTVAEETKSLNKMFPDKTW